MEGKYDNDKVSVIIPMYNAEEYIDLTVNSILTQTYKNIEIIIVDDCSNDNSGKDIQSLSEEFSCIIYHLQEKNKGVALARNTGMKLATGRYIAFCDSDDLWTKDKLEKQLDLMKKKNTGFIFSAIEMIDEKGNLIHSKRRIKKEVSYKYLLKNTVIPTSSVIIDRNKIKEFEMPKVRKGEDYATWLMLLRSGEIACGVDEALVKYRVRENSLSSNKIKNIKVIWDIQVVQEKINPILSFYYCCCYAENALKKYLIE